MSRTIKGDEILWDMRKRIEALEEHVKLLINERQTAMERRTYAERQARGEVR